MADIRDFAERVAKMYGDRQNAITGTPEERRRQGQLPAASEAASALVKAAYDASHIADEGRFPVTCLMCYPVDAFHDIHMQFSAPRPANAQEIAKLAHAIDNQSHIACIAQPDGISLNGFHVNMLLNQRECGYFSGHIGNPLKVRIKGPGHLEVSCAGVPIVLRAGHITQETPLTYSDSMERLVARITKDLSYYTDGPIESLEDIFNDLIRHIVRLGHGGILIFSADPTRGSFSLSRPLNCNYLFRLLCNYWRDVASLVEAAGGLANLMSMDDTTSVNPEMMDVTRATDQLENCLPSIANLAGVDGAIVMNYECNVGAFNAIIKRQNPPDPLPKLVDEHGMDVDEEEAFRHRGSRHQSGLLFARCVPDSFTFVISQDGSISAFHNSGDGKVIYQHSLRAVE